jgi:hypothetical protein
MTSPLLNPYIGHECPRMNYSPCDVEIKCPGCPLKPRNTGSRYEMLKKSVEENRQRIRVEESLKKHKDDPIKIVLWKF